MRKSKRLIGLLVAGAVLAVACGEDSKKSVPSGADAGGVGVDAGEAADAAVADTVTTTVFGTVRDESGQAVAGAAIAAHGRTATSDADGAFALSGLAVPRGRCVASAKKQGFLAAYRAAAPVAGGATELRFTLLAAQSEAVGAAGGAVADGNAKVAFGADSFSAAGNVQVAARHIDPSQPSFNAVFPGDLSAQRSDGSDSTLYSFGVLQVELQDASGAKVGLAAGKKATITIPVPASQLAQAPATIPLWYFDEALGQWKEEGVAELQGDKYVGEVAHFTPWNADEPSETAYLKGRVICGGEPVPGVTVDATQGEAITGAAGTFRMAVPARRSFEVAVAASRNDNLFGMTGKRSVPAIPPEQTHDLGDLVLDECPTRIKGQIIGCADTAVAGVVVATWGGTTRVVHAAGAFLMIVPPDTDLTLRARTDSAESALVTVRSPPKGETQDVGNLKACAGSGGCDFLDIPSTARQVRLSPDGTLVAALSFKNGAQLHRTSDGSLVHDLTDPDWADMGYGQFTTDGKRLSITTMYGALPRVYDVTTGQLVHAFTDPVLESSYLLDDGKLLGVTDSGHQLGLYDPEAGGALVKTLGLTGTTDLHLIGLRSGGTRALLLSDFAAATQKVIVWDVQSDTKVTEFATGSSMLFGSNTHSLSLDGSVLGLPMFVSLDFTAAFFDTATGQRLSSTDFPTGTVSGLAIRPDNQAFAGQKSAGGGKYAPPAVFSLPDYAPGRDLPFPDGADVRDFAWSDDGTLLAGVRDGKFIRLWKMGTCK